MAHLFALTNIKKGMAGACALAILVWAAFYAFLWFEADARRTSAAGMIRQHFHLPSSATAARVLVTNKNPWVNPPTIEAIFAFPEAAYRDWTSQLENPAIWSPQSLAYDGAVFDGVWAPDALRWTGRDQNRELSWGSLSARHAQTVRNGRLLCFAIHRPSERGQQHTPAALPCSAIANASAVYVQGLLDPEARKLHMLIRAIRRPA